MSKFDLTGALFPNDKDGRENRPDYKGDVTIGGVKYELAAWKRPYVKGEYLSVKVELPKAE
jgi:uncharacterized protein (DUF736 family)